MKTKEELLLDYKRTNKSRRPNVLKKAGYATEAEYFAYLMEPDTTTGSPEAAKLFKRNEKEEDMLDQVIAFDTTGSMASYISSVKKHVKELIPKLFSENPNLRLKIIAFGDYCDMVSETNYGKAYQESALTDDANKLIDFVQTAQTTSGGDADEFYELVIKKVVEETPWRKGSKRAMLLIGDCGPHHVGYSCNNKVRNAQVDWKAEAEKAAGIGLQIDTLNCGATYQQLFYRPLSQITNGINIPFSSSEKTQHAVYAATSVRGSLKSKAAFAASYNTALASGDEELIGTYKSLSSKI